MVEHYIYQPDYSEKAINTESLSFIILCCKYSLTMLGVVVVVWSLDLQLPVQSMSITTNVVSSYPVHGEVYSIQHYVIMCVSDL